VDPPGSVWTTANAAWSPLTNSGAFSPLVGTLRLETNFSIENPRNDRPHFDSKQLYHTVRINSNERLRQDDDTLARSSRGQKLPFAGRRNMNNCSNGRLNWGEAMVPPAESTRHAIIKAAIDPTSPKSCSAQVTHRLDLGDWV
jgi:hypothetical protein